MRNLKKVLSLVLCMAMMLSVMVMGAGAAFTDQEEIVNTEAVETCVALNIIGGYPDGSYMPEGNITRAQACKLICVALNGGKEPVLGTNATPSFTDIDGNWAEAYIESCLAQGIVSGVGGGKFNPNGNVTGSQFAKMLLTALGYRADHEAFTGDAWEVNVNVRATQKNLYDELETMDPSVALSRDNAAQMVWNALQAVEVEYKYTLDGSDGALSSKAEVVDKTHRVAGSDVGTTLLWDKYSGLVNIGYLTGYTYDSVKEQWAYTFDSATNFGSAAITGNDALTRATTLKSADDYTDLFGQRVKIVYKNNGTSIYGVFADDSEVLASGVTGDIGDIDTTKNTVEIGDVDYKVDNATTIAIYNTNNPAVTATTLATLKADTSAYMFELVDNDGDNKGDAIILTPMAIGEITYVGTDSITIGSSPVNGTYDIEDIAIYEDYAKGDWVYFISALYAPTQADTFEYAELVTATVDAVKGGTSAANYTDYTLEGSWYSRTTATGYTVDRADLNDTIEFVALGSTIFYADIVDVAATSKDIAMVVTADTVSGEGASNNLGSATVKAKLIFADGKKQTVVVAKVNGSAATFAGSPAAATDVDTRIGSLVTYRINSDGEYELTDVSATNLAGYKTYGTTAAYTNKTVGGAELADDAIVFVLTVGAMDTPGGTNDAKVYTGKEMKNAYGAGTFGSAGQGQVLTAMENGFSYGKVAAIAAGSVPAITKGSNYGYLTAGAYYTYEGDKTFINYTFWTAEGKEVTAKEESTNALAPYAAGALITFDEVEEGVIKNVTPVVATTSVVTGWDKEEKIQIAGLGSSKVDATDTVVIFVNSETKKGAEGGEIRIGEDMLLNDDIADQNNVRYVGNTTVLDLLVVDVANKMHAAPAMTFSAVPTTTNLAAAFSSSDEVVISTALTGSNITALGVPAAGKTIVAENGLTATNVAHVARTLVASAGAIEADAPAYKMAGNSVVTDFGSSSLATQAVSSNNAGTLSSNSYALYVVDFNSITGVTPGTSTFTYDGGTPVTMDSDGLHWHLVGNKTGSTTFTIDLDGAGPNTATVPVVVTWPTW